MSKTVRFGVPQVAPLAILEPGMVIQFPEGAIASGLGEMGLDAQTEYTVNAVGTHDDNPLVAHVEVIRDGFAVLSGDEAPVAFDAIMFATVGVLEANLTNDDYDEAVRDGYPVTLVSDNGPDKG